MAETLVFPNISFDESDVGESPISPIEGNRIGVVGKFLKGPVNRFTVATKSNFSELFGLSNHNGSLAVQTAMAQGANDFGIVRVAGSPILASASLQFKLPEGQPAVAGSEKISVLGTAFKIPFLGSGIDTAQILARNFANAIRGRFAGINDVSVNGDVVSMTTNIPLNANLPIKFIVRNQSEKSSDTSESLSGIAIRGSDKVTSLSTVSSGLEGLSYTESDGKVLRFSNGELHIKFFVNSSQKDKDGGTTGTKLPSTNNSATIHVLMGAEFTTADGQHGPSQIASGLVKDINDRRIGFTAELGSSPGVLHLITKISNTAEANRCKFYFFREDKDGGSLDSGLRVEFKDGNLGSSYALLAQNELKNFGGGVDGPTRSVKTVQALNFLRKAPIIDPVNGIAPVMNGAALADSKTDTVSFIDGEVSLGLNTKYELKLASPVTVRRNTNSDIYAYINSAGAIEVGLTPGAGTQNSVLIGKYIGLTGADVDDKDKKGSFVSAVPRNGDILRIEAVSEGAWSSGIVLNVSSTKSSSGEVTVNVTATLGTLTETVSFSLSDPVAFDDTVPYPILKETKYSNLISISYVGIIEENKNSLLKVVSDQNFDVYGSDGPEPSTANWLEALRVLGQNPVNIILASGNTSPAVRQALIKQAEESDEIVGLRIAVLAADKRMIPQAARDLTDNVAYDSKYAVMVGGYCTYTGNSDLNLMPLSVPPDGFYAGHLAQTPVHISPAARTSSRPFQGISAVENPAVGSAAYNDYTKARVELIIADQVTKEFHCLNGRSLSKDDRWKWIALRRTYNYIRANAFAILQFAKSEPNTEELRGKVTSKLENFLYIMASSGQIDKAFKVQADSSNNTPNQVAMGMLRVDMFFTPVYPADIIRVGLHRLVIPVPLTVPTGN